MHHYPFHPGDYMLSTAHLSLEEDATYRRALDLYYSNEGPLAFDKRTLSKRLRVDEQTLEAVLSEFFEETPEGWRHARCDAEITRYQAKSEKAKLAGAQGGKAKAAASLANAKRTPSERLATRTKNQELEPGTNNHSTTAKAVGRIAPRSPQLPDEQWIQDLENDPIYQGLNIRQELGKMQRWCEVNRKKPSRTRFVNWINRAEKPLAVNGARPAGKHQAFNNANATAGKTPEEIGLF